jgi:hypothetical protein
MFESQHAIASLGISENSGGRGMRLAVGNGACVGGGVVRGVIVDVELSAVVSSTHKQSHQRIDPLTSNNGHKKNQKGEQIKILYEYRHSKGDFAC